MGSEGTHRIIAWAPPQGPRTPRHHAEARPVSECRSGNDEPFEHGEVFVTDDGGETDLDLGHYERFIDENLTTDSNGTTGSIYSAVIAAERRGDYLGKTVQVIPHITNEIKRRINRLVSDDVDVIITEVGGTVGDIEILPFLEAIRQFRLDVGRNNVCYVHVTLVPFIGPSGEMKTKPTQHSVTELRSRVFSPMRSSADRRNRSVLISAARSPISAMCRSLVLPMPPTRRVSTRFRSCCTTRASTNTSATSWGSVMPPSISLPGKNSCVVSRRPRHRSVSA